MGLIASMHLRVLRLKSASPADEQGAALVEYALLLVLIAVFCLLAVTFLGTQAANKFSKVGESVAAA